MVSPYTRLVLHCDKSSVCRPIKSGFRFFSPKHFLLCSSFLNLHSWRSLRYLKCLPENAMHKRELTTHSMGRLCTACSGCIVVPGNVLTRRCGITAGAVMGAAPGRPVRPLVRHLECASSASSKIVFLRLTRLKTNTITSHPSQYNRADGVGDEINKPPRRRD